MWGWDGMSPFKDKKAVSFWPLIFINMLLPESMRYDPRNIIILYIATSATSGQPKNFEPHLSVVTDELILAANGFDLQVRGETVRVHLVAPIFTADARGDPPPPTHTHQPQTQTHPARLSTTGREKITNRAACGTAKAGCGDCTAMADRCLLALLLHLVPTVTSYWDLDCSEDHHALLLFGPAFAHNTMVN